MGEIFAPPLIQAQSWEEAQRKFNEVIRQLARQLNSIYTGANIPTARIKADAITGAKIADDVVDSEHYVADSIDTEHLSADCITANEIYAGTITATELATNCVTAIKILADAVTATKINVVGLDGTSGKINLTQIESGDLDNIDDGTTYAKVLNTDITAGHVLLTEVTGDLDDVTDGSTYAKVLNTDITAGHILLTEVTGDLDDVTDGSTYGKVALTGITAGKIVVAGLGTDALARMFTSSTIQGYIEAWRHLYDVLWLDTNNIVWSDSNNIIWEETNSTDVTLIDGGDIYARTITANQIAARTITASQIAATTITATEIAADTITANEIAATTITAAQIAALTITAAQIAVGTITATEIATDAIETTKIKALAVTAAKIAADTITANEIAATTITGTELNISTLDAISANIGTLTAGTITSGITVNSLWRNVHSWTATSNVTSHTVSSLTGNTAIQYLIECRWVRYRDGAADPMNYIICLNDDTAANYGFTTNWTVNGVHGGSEDAAFDGIWIGRADENTELSQGRGVLNAISGFWRTFSGQFSSSINGADIERLYSCECSWTNTAAEITSMVFYAETASGIGIGSHIDIYARIA